MNIAQALLDALKARGAREVFGIPGDFALPFFKIVEESATLPLYCLSHEPAVGFAADAAARANCAIGVAAVTYGAGAFNLVSARTPIPGQEESTCEQCKSSNGVSHSKDESIPIQNRKMRKCY